MQAEIVGFFCAAGFGDGLEVGFNREIVEAGPTLDLVDVQLYLKEGGYWRVQGGHRGGVGRGRRVCRKDHEVAHFVAVVFDDP